jgi:hypothetical protein
VEPPKCGWFGPALDAGFFILQQCLVAVAKGKKFRKEFRKPSPGNEARSSIPETGAELEGKFAQSDR